MDKFSVELNGITRDEYLAASHENFRKLYTALPICIIIICGLIMILTGNYSAKAIIWPIVVYIIVIILAEYFMRHNYNDQLSEFGPITYSFDDIKWEVTAGEEHHSFNWEATPTLRIKKNAIFLYNDEVNSNLVPTRLLTDEQLNQISIWFKQSRTKAKSYQKNLYHQEAQQFKMRHQNDTFMGRGPAWGPFRRKK